LVCTDTPFLERGWLIKAKLPPSLAFCIRYYNYTTRRARGVATMRLGLRVVIGPRRKSNVPGLQRLAHHAHRILVQPVQVGHLAQPWRRTRPGSLLRQHFLHYFSEEVPNSRTGHPNCGEFPFHALG
jgi:hypothetical protein